MALLEPELGPLSSFRDSGIDVLLDNGCADPTGRFHFLAIVVEVIGYDSLCAVFVGEDLLRGKGGRVIKLLVIGPVGSTAKKELQVSTGSRPKGKKGPEGFRREDCAHFCTRDMLFSVKVVWMDGFDVCGCCSLRK
jgi:hypothetical protein